MIGTCVIYCLKTRPAFFFWTCRLIDGLSKLPEIKTNKKNPIPQILREFLFSGQGQAVRCTRSQSVPWEIFARVHFQFQSPTANISKQWRWYVQEVRSLLILNQISNCYIMHCYPLGKKNNNVASLLVSLCFRAVTTWCEKWDSNWFNSFRNSGIGTNLTMASSSGQGVAAVMLTRFWTTRGDPLRNCEKLIQMFKDWCEKNGWYDSEPRLHLKHQKKERIPCLWSQSGFQKGKLWQLSVQPLLHGT